MIRWDIFIYCTIVAITLTKISSADFLIVENGISKVKILLSSDADATEKLAAKELNTYLKKISGASLPVTTDPTEDAPVIQIGIRSEELRQRLHLGNLAFDGFVIDCNDERLILAGNLPEGTLNAVYGFLEEVLGVRWFMPTALGENVPRRSTIRVAPMLRRVEPCFVNRRNHGINLSIPGEGAVWRRRVRITSHDLSVPFNRYSHNLYRIFPVSRYGKTHPEYYPMLGGKRHIPATDHAQDWQPCTTNPEVIALTVAAAKRWFREHPEANFFSVGMNDSAAFCNCDNCKALDIPGEEFRGRKMVSDRYFTFVKKVADALYKTYPDKYITCIAYSVVESPPRRVKLPSNVGVVITQDVAQWHDPAYKRADMKLARAWAKAAGAFGTYDYTGLTWMMPRVYPHAMAESLRFYASIGAVAVTNEAFPTWWYAAPQLYLRAKLMWNPQLDTDVVLDEFYAGFFGPAQEDMKRLYDVFERCMMKERPGRWFEGLSSVLEQMDLWERNDLVACQDALRAAKEKCKGQEPFSARVEFVARGFAWSEALLEEYWQAQRVREAASSPKTSAEQLVGHVQKLLELTAHRESVWKSIRDDRLISGIYRLVFDHFASRLATWRSYLQSSASMGISALVTEPGGFSVNELRKFAQEVSESQLAYELHGYLWVMEHPNAENLCKNPGFDETKAVGHAPKGIRWVATNAPPDWSKWALKDKNIDKLTWEAKGGRSGSRCVKIAGVQDACFIQVLPARPGDRYYVSVWARSEGSKEAQVRLVVQWKDANGAWVWSQPRREVRALSGYQDWRRISLVFTVPDGVAYVVVLLAAKGQQLDDVAYFDDVRVVKLSVGTKGAATKHTR